jgi:hypothetical protein
MCAFSHSILKTLNFAERDSTAVDSESTWQANPTWQDTTTETLALHEKSTGSQRAALCASLLDLAWHFGELSARSGKA